MRILLKIHLLSYLFLYTNMLCAQNQNESLATPSSTQLKGDSTLPNLNYQNKVVGDQIYPSMGDSNIEKEIQNNIKNSAKILGSSLNPHGNPVLTPSPAPVENLPTPSPVKTPDVVVLEKPAANIPAPIEKVDLNQFNPPPPTMNKVTNIQPPPPSYFDMPNGIRIFSSNIQKKQRKNKTVELPATSVALGHLMEGIEVGITNDVQRIGITLDYAFLGPNGGYVQMKGCNLLVDVYAKYSFSRIRGSLVSLTCRSPNGQTFTIPVSGHLISATDQMEYKGLDGTIFMPGKGTAAVLSLLQGAVTAFGQAMAAAQVHTQAASSQLSSPVQSSNVTGNQNLYIAGQTVAGAAGNFMNWFVDFYKNMEVGVAVEPGRKTFIMLEETTYVPKIFFGEQVSEKFISFVNDKMQNIHNPESNFNTALSEKSSSIYSNPYLKNRNH